VPQIDPGVPVPQIDPGVPVPQIDTESPQLVEESESISNMKKEVKKTEEILSLEDEKFVDGIINYAKERVEKDNDIDEGSKLLLTKLTPDETKALVSAQIQFIEYGLPDMQTGTTVPSGKVGDNESPQSTRTMNRLLRSNFLHHRYRGLQYQNSTIIVTMIHQYQNVRARVVNSLMNTVLRTMDNVCRLTTTV
jgi:hypothetical protein